jgi:hypothetical protein
MKILIVYTPRSKSTWLTHVLAKKYNLENWLELLTRSRRRNQDFNDFQKLIKKINTTDNICVKITGGNDFIDLKNRSIINDYKTIDYNSFDYIILLSRDDYISATLSYAYTDQLDDRTWHRRRNEVKIGKSYIVGESKIYYMLRGYIIYKFVKDYIMNHADRKKILEYEFESVESCVKKDFKLNENDFDIELADNKLNYFELVSNKNSILEIKKIYDQMKFLTLEDIKDTNSFFWNHSNQSIL